MSGRGSGLSSGHSDLDWGAVSSSSEISVSGWKKNPVVIRASGWDSVGAQDVAIKSLNRGFLRTLQVAATKPKQEFRIQWHGRRQNCPDAHIKPRNRPRIAGIHAGPLGILSSSSTVSLPWRTITLLT